MLLYATKRDFTSVLMVRNLEMGRLSWNYLGGPLKKAEASVRAADKEKADKTRHDRDSVLLLALKTGCSGTRGQSLL